jgi:hypothetical protein
MAWLPSSLQSVNVDVELNNPAGAGNWFQVGRRVFLSLPRAALATAELSLPVILPADPVRCPTRNDMVVHERVECSIGFLTFVGVYDNGER